MSIVSHKSFDGSLGQDAVPAMVLFHEGAEYIVVKGSDIETLKGLVNDYHKAMLEFGTPVPSSGYTVPGRVYPAVVLIPGSGKDIEGPAGYSKAESELVDMIDGKGTLLTFRIDGKTVDAARLKGNLTLHTAATEDWSEKHHSAFYSRFE
jgi:hypothetical protein